MSKLIPMEEAAEFLGMSVEELNELRENNEVFGYRDGSTWKFKKTELERVASQSGFLTGSAGAAVDKGKDSIGLSSGGDEGDLINDSGDLSFEIDESLEDMVLEDDSDSIAMEDSSLDLFQPPGPKSGGGTSSDILSLDEDDDDDDMIDLAESGLLIKSGSKSSLLNLTDDDDEDEDEGNLDDSAGELNLATEADLEESKKDVDLADVGSFNLSDDESVLSGGDDELSFGSSSLELASGNEKKSGSPSTGDDVLDSEPKSTGSPSETGNLLGADDGDDDLMLAGDDLDLELADSGSFSEGLGDSSSSELVLEEDSSDDLILEANESGIALSPNESGLMLGDEPLELGGSDIDELELPEEDDDLFALDGDADPEMAPLMQEDDFSLTPHELSMDDDDASGSQIIALADSEIYADDSEATLLGDGDGDYSEPGMYDEGLDGGYDPATGAAPGYANVAALPEAPYTIGQIISLIATVLVLFIGSIVAYGMAQNLWMPDDQVVNSGLISLLLEAFGLKS